MLYMPHGGESGVIQAWYQGDHSWVEFRGPAFTDWDPEIPPSAFEHVHNRLLGMHCTVLHQDQILVLIRGRHSDFELIEEAMNSINLATIAYPDDAVSPPFLTLGRPLNDLPIFSFDS